jgi:hypothetical protein
VEKYTVPTSSLVKCKIVNCEKIEEKEQAAAFHNYLFISPITVYQSYINISFEPGGGR